MSSKLNPLFPIACNIVLLAWAGVAFFLTDWIVSWLYMPDTTTWSEWAVWWILTLALLFAAIGPVTFLLVSPVLWCVAHVFAYLESKQPAELDSE